MTKSRKSFDNNLNTSNYYFVLTAVALGKTCDGVNSDISSPQVHKKAHLFYNPPKLRLVTYRYSQHKADVIHLFAAQLISQNFDLKDSNILLSFVMNYPLLPCLEVYVAGKKKK